MKPKPEPEPIGEDALRLEADFIRRCRDCEPVDITPFCSQCGGEISAKSHTGLCRRCYDRRTAKPSDNWG